MTRIVIGAALAAFASLPALTAIAQELQPRPEFKGALTLPSKDGASQTANIDVQSWELPNQNGAVHELPLTGFYVAHLLSGNIAATIAGQTTNHVPGAYWTVATGATMQVKVLSEFAVLETLTVAKP